MHYYKRNLGDYSKKAGRLSMLQHGAYTLLIDSCYDREQFPTLEEALDWTWASSKEEVEAVQFVLKRFFTLEDGIYVQARIKEEIDAYHEKAETNKRIAIEREQKRKQKTGKGARVVEDETRNVHEAPPNQEPRTKNQYIKDSSLNAHDQNSPPADNSGTQSDNSGQQPSVDNSHDTADNSCTGEQLAFDAQYLKLARATGISADHSDADIRAIFDLFRCYKANANTLKTPSDWLGAWRTWCQREKVNYAKSNKKTGTGYTGQRPENNVQRAMRVAQQAAERLAATGNDNCGLAPD